MATPNIADNMILLPVRVAVFFVGKKAKEPDLAIKLVTRLCRFYEAKRLKEPKKHKKSRWRDCTARLPDDRYFKRNQKSLDFLFL